MCAADGNATQPYSFPLYDICDVIIDEKDSGYGFISFSAWPADRFTAPTWDRISVVPGSRQSLLLVSLENITVSVPATGFERSQPICLDVILDSGNPTSNLPRELSGPLLVAVASLSAARGFQGAGLSDDVQVSFTFKTTEAQPASYPHGRTDTRTVRGSATKFFCLRFGTKPIAEIVSPLGFSKSTAYPNLGMKFFRTFFVGFIDTASAPAVLLAPQVWKLRSTTAETMRARSSQWQRPRSGFSHTI